MRRKLLLTLIVALAVLSSLFVGAIAGRFWLAPETSIKTYVNSQTILTSLRDQGFLVTRTYVFDQPVTITKTTGNPFKDFFVGQTVEARGTMEANLGIDLSKLTADDITMTDQTVTVRVPAASLFNARLLGPVDVKNDQGVLKRILENEDGYNEALAELSKTEPMSLPLSTHSAKAPSSPLASAATTGRGEPVTVAMVSGAL